MSRSLIHYNKLQKLDIKIIEPKKKIIYGVTPRNNILSL